MRVTFKNLMHKMRALFAVLILTLNMLPISMFATSGTASASSTQQPCYEQITEYRYRTRTYRPSNTVERKFVNGYNFVDNGTVNFTNQSGVQVTVSGHWVASSGWHQIPDSVINAYWGTGGITSSLLGGDEDHPKGTVPLSVYGGPSVNVQYYANELTITGGYTDWGPWSNWSTANPGSSTETKEVQSELHNHEIPCKGSITIKKDAQPNSDDDFSFFFDKVGSSNDGETFKLDDNGNESGTKSSQTFNNLPVATYIVSEGQYNGWTLSDIACSGGANITKNVAERKVTIVLNGNENVTCTFVNQKNGSIKIVKDAQPNSKDDFSFTTNVPGQNQFKLDDDQGVNGGNSDYNNYKNFSNLTPGTTYTFTENSTDGWYLESIECSAGANAVVNGSTVSVTLSPDQAVTCTFINKKKDPVHIKVTKYVTKDNGGNASVNEFTLKVGDTTVLSGANNTFEGNKSYTVTEMGGPSGYTQTALVCKDVTDPYHPVVLNGATFVAAYGHNYSCDITNDDIAPTLKLVKNVVNQYGEPAAASSWTLAATPASNSVGATTVSGAGGFGPTNVFAGIEYTLSETGGPSGYTNGTTWTCDGVVLSGGNKVTLALDQDAVCTITNTKDPEGSVSGYKWNDEDQDGRWDWNEHGLNHWTISLYKECDTLVALKNIKNSYCFGGWQWQKNDLTNFWGQYEFNGLAPGTYKVCEVQQFGWAQTYPVYNHGCHTFEINRGNEQICDKNFGNTQNGKLIVKKVVKDSSDTEEEFDFNVSGWFTNKNFELANGQKESTTLKTGWYNVKEILPEGSEWVLDSIDCGWGTKRDDNGTWVYIVPGATTKCTFVNKLKSIEVIATPVCRNNFPYLQWSVKANNFDPSHIKLTWLKADGTSAGSDPALEVEYTGAALAAVKTGDGEYSDIISWPGSDPTIPDWPGYTLVNGQWVVDPTDLGGNLRPSAKVKFEVNPETTVDVSYPPAAAGCPDPSNGHVLGSSTLMNTGTPASNGLIAGLSILGAAAGVTYASRKRKLN